MKGCKIQYQQSPMSNPTSAINLDELIWRLEEFKKIYGPDIFVIAFGASELRFYKKINNGGDAEYLTQFFWD